jgi:hypothetical protein
LRRQGEEIAARRELESAAGEIDRACAQGGIGSGCPCSRFRR